MKVSVHNLVGSAQVPVDEREQTIVELCERSVQRLAAAMPGIEVGCLFRFGDVLRHLAHAGTMRLIYEVPREQGGVVWRAADEARIQLVKDVRADPDYLPSDDRISSEIAAPVIVGGALVGIIDVEFPGRVFDQDAVESIESEARRLADELAPYVT